MKIEIYDQLYNVNGEQNEEYLKELAAYVDGKMRTIAESTHMVTFMYTTKCVSAVKRDI